MVKSRMLSFGYKRKVAFVKSVLEYFSGVLTKIVRPTFIGFDILFVSDPCGSRKYRDDYILSTQWLPLLLLSIRKSGGLQAAHYIRSF